MRAPTDIDLTSVVCPTTPPQQAGTETFGQGAFGVSVWTTVRAIELRTSHNNYACYLASQRLVNRSGNRASVIAQQPGLLLSSRRLA